MANYTFSINEQGWDTSSFSWTNTDGSPGLGCLVAGDPDGVTNVGTSLAVSTAVSSGDPISFRVRILANSGDLGTVYCTLSADSSVLAELVSITALPFDSGWLTVSGTMTTTETVDTFSFAAAAADGIIFIVYLDSIYIAEAPPGAEGYRHSAGGIPGAVLVT